MSKLVIALVALLSLALSVSAVPPYKLVGSAYCDPCHFGFESSLSYSVHGATVDLICKDRLSDEVIYNDTVRTNPKGKYKFIVNKDFGDCNCDVVLRHSPLEDCHVVDPGRSSSRVIVTDFNGMGSERRYANNMGYFHNQVHPGCAELRKFYFQSDDE